MASARPSRFPIVIVLALATAGCLGAESPGEGSTPPSTNTSSTTPSPTSSAPQGDESEGSPAGPLTYPVYLTSSRGLSVTAPDAPGAVPESTSFFDPQAFSGDLPLAPFVEEVAVREGFRVTRLLLDLYFTTDVPQAAQSTAVGFKPVVIWYGEVGRLSASVQVDAPTTLTEGEVVHVTAELPTPEGGFVYEAGSLPALLVGFGYTQDTNRPILILTGGETASRLTVTSEAYALPGDLVERSETFQGTFQYNTYYTGNPADETQVRQSFPFVVSSLTRKIDIELVGSGATGHHDLDLTVLGPGGEILWGSHSPNAWEIVRLYDVNLRAPGEYLLVVDNFQSVNGAYKVTARAWDARDDPSAVAGG